MFLIAFIVMSIVEGLAMFPLRKCDEYCSEEALKIICLYYRFHGYVDSCKVINNPLQLE
jgi:hypothetical protein